MTTQGLIRIAIYILILVMGNTMLAWAAPSMMDSPAITFSKEDQKLTVQVDGVPLREVLQALANQLPITITLMGFEGDNRLSTTFTDLPLEQGIERLLQGQDYAFLYSRANSSRKTPLKEIIVLPRQNLTTNSTATETMVVMSPTVNHQESQKDRKQSHFNNLEHQKFELNELANKVEALVQLSDQNQPQSLSLLTQASKDLDPEIRATAIALIEQLESPPQ